MDIITTEKKWQVPGESSVCALIKIKVSIAPSSDRQFFFSFLIICILICIELFLFWPGCFTCCMESGLRIYNVEPLVEKAHFENELMGSIAIGEMLWRTNVIAVVAGGTRPKFADNTVLIYDDLAKKFIMEITFTSSIKAVRLRRDKYVQSFSDAFL